jgi:uncharacterized damage-inducible protein DinB
MTVFEWQASVIENLGAMMAHTLASTREDRLDWRPSAEPESQTRSALDQAAEVINVNRRMATLFRNETPPEQTPQRPFETPQEAVERIRESARELADVVRSLDESALTRPLPTRRGPMPGAQALQIVAANMSYHTGQINFIQTLYGDMEFHLPPQPSENAEK